MAGLKPTYHEVCSVTKSARLVVTVSTYSDEIYLSASLFHGAAKSRSLAFGSSRPLRDCRLEIEANGDTCLWIGSAAFDIAPQEADRVVNLLGIRVNREQEARGK